jgi:hypothetical protein
LALKKLKKNLVLVKLLFRMDSPTPRRRRSRGEVLDTLATLFGNYVGGSNTTNDDGEDTASVSTSFTDRTPRKTSTTRHSVTTPDDNESQIDTTRRNNNNHNHRHTNNKKVEDDNNDDRYEGEELAVAAAVRVNKENIRLRALVESTAERMQTALESLRDKDISQQHSLSIQIEKTTQLEKELVSTRIELEKSNREISTLRQEMENMKIELQNETQRAELMSSEQKKQEKEMGELKSQKLLLTQRIERLASEAEAKVIEAASRSASAQSQQSFKNELALVQSRCNELVEEVAILTADKDRLALLLKKGRALSDQHFLGPSSSSLSDTPLISNEDAAISTATVVEWKDAPNWVPVGVVQASTAFIKRYPSVHQRDMKDFLIACNSVWHSRLQAISDSVEKSATRRTKMLHTPYREVLQASTISRLRSTISNLQALLQAQNPASVRFTSASVDLPRLTPGETILLRRGGHGADVVHAKTNASISSFNRPKSASKMHVATEARLLSVPGSGGKRLDAEESRRLFDEAMECIDYLSRRLETEEGRGSGFPNLNNKNEEEEDYRLSEDERRRLGDAGGDYARRIEGGDGGGRQERLTTTSSYPPSSYPSSSSFMSSSSSTTSLRQNLPDVTSAASRTLRFDEHLNQQQQQQQQQQQPFSSLKYPKEKGGLSDALSAAASPPRFSTSNTTYNKRSIESW